MFFVNQLSSHTFFDLCTITHQVVEESILLQIKAFLNDLHLY